MHQSTVKTIQHSRILVSPLNWGLGHVSRTIPIIQQLIDQNNELIIFCNQEQEEFYRQFFPELWYVPHEGYPFKFNGKGKWTTDILKNMGALQSFLWEEEEKVNTWVEKFNPDLIISDQRFGFKSKKVKSIIISHQLNLPVSKWNFAAQLWNKKLLSQFDELWIPDCSKQKTSGKLSNGRHKSKHFIGNCSRFITKSNSHKNQKYKYLAIVSGPLPYSHQLLDLLLSKLSLTTEKSAIIVPNSLVFEKQILDNVEIFVHPAHETFSALINSSETLISRSGYSTIMDLLSIEKKAILIPTPGQVEQEYLSKFHSNNKNWKFIKEKDWDRVKL